MEVVLGSAHVDGEGVFEQAEPGQSSFQAVDGAARWLERLVQVVGGRVVGGALGEGCPLLTTKALFEAVAATGTVRQGSRAGSAPSRHPQAARSYSLHSYVICDLCDRRMFGKTRRDAAYYACEPDRRHHAQRSGWYPGHPASLWVREDDLLAVVHGFFASHIFGPHRLNLLTAQLASQPTPPSQDRDAERRKTLRKALADIDRRKRALVTELENPADTGDPDTDREFRQAIQRRFTELAAEHRAKTAELAELDTTAAQPEPGDRSRLDALPQIPVDQIPETMQRDLYEVF